MEALSAAELTASCAVWGMKKTQKPPLSVFLLGILAGAMIAFTSAATNTASFGFENQGLARVVCGVIFPFGLGMVILMGAELFTSNALLPIAVWSKKLTAPKMLLHWLYSYLGNVVGSLLVAIGCALFGQLKWGNGSLAVYTIQMGITKSTAAFEKSFVQGIMCNVLVCLAVLMSLAARDVPGKILACYLPICLFITCGFDHCVANMFYLFAALLATTVPQYAELAIAAGVDLSAMNIPGILHNLIPVTLGNVVGGVTLSALLYQVYLKEH